MTDTNVKKIAAIVGVTLIGVALIGVMILNAFFPSTLYQFGQQKQAGKNIIDQTQTAENAINNYEWFKTQKQKIDSMREKIENQRQQIKTFKQTYGDDPSKWDRTTKEQYNRMTNRLLGYQNQHENLVADYNARSNMQNRNVFKDKLPYEMEKKFFTGDIVP